MVEQIEIKVIDDKSHHLQTVIALGDANQPTLSFFPKGAFEEYAANRKIICALASPENCIGYLLYRTSRSYNRVTIIHLCLDPSYRGKGIAKKLVDHLIQLTQDYSGIGLTCRRDYQLQNLWSKLGFVAKYDEPAKTPGKFNTYWWLDYGKSDLINKLEHLQNITEYQPVRLAGTSLKQVRVQNLKDNSFYKNFNADKQGETKAEFQQNLRRFITENDKFECLVILEGEQEPTALVVYERHKDYELEIPMLRVRENPLAGTLAHHLLFQAISISAREHRSFTLITDIHLQDVVKTAIQKDMFVTATHGWLKANIAKAETVSTLAVHLDKLAKSLGKDYQFINYFVQTLKHENSVNTIAAMSDLERVLYPLKIIDSNSPTFIIPIHPFWAHQLFDSKLANQTLLGATKQNIALNREAVYYKSKHPAPQELKPGVRGRILWYVSRDKDGGYKGVSAIRACSRLDEVVIGKPKELYRRFRNLGIYELDNVIDIAQKQDDDIMAIRFGDTELFVKPVLLKNVKTILGKQGNIQSPVYISKEKFAKIYTLGIYASN
ncbi:GNAT family N-acetyltransferase [Coleofasciculus sp. F4-SAH-05]|uniref:GNAT family N-acetyltransferase n=1 Tax=Coleofasciculus sp. F4-SAH-05 TaxID=3069525 RepID=UPI0032F31C35